MTRFEKRISNATKAFSIAIAERVRDFSFLPEVEDVLHREGTPCINGHTLRYISSGNCVECCKTARKKSKEVHV